MGRRVSIGPVARIEGHAEVTLELGEDGRVADARVHVAQLRGFEAFCAGRLLGEMPALTARVCGICPVSHAVASAMAGDAILGAEPPPAARRLRALLQLAQLVQSHALSFFHLSGPDLPAGPEGGPPRGSLLDLAASDPELARDGVALRRFGQETIERIAGRRIHPAYPVPGGVARPLDPGAREEILAALPGALARATRVLEGFWRRLPRHAAEAERLELDTLFLALVGPGGELELAGGRLRVADASGAILAAGVDPARYPELVAEEAAPWTYARLAHWRALGPEAGVYRVGPLARLNLASRCGTPLADAALERFRALAAGPVRSTFHAHAARLVEIVFALERIGGLLGDPAILSGDVLAPPGAARREGVGACEAPRGTLFHRYEVDPNGVVAGVDLLVATGQNQLAMGRTVRRIARGFGPWSAGPAAEALRTRIEEGIRAFDPCLSCAAHPAGAAALAVRVVGPRGEPLGELAPR